MKNVFYGALMLIVTTTACDKDPKRPVVLFLNAQIPFYGAPFFYF
jgi:energy-converting hydrogenase Eha subunit E